MITRIDEPTPNGGDYAIAIYEDENGFECDIEEAKYISIFEYTNAGEGVMHTLGLCEHNQEEATA